MASSLNLSNKAAVQQATFVRMEITENGLPVIVRMSTHDVPFTITELDGQPYLYPAVGALLNVSTITTDNKASQSDVTVTLSGIPNQYISQIIANPIKGSPVQIRRVFFDATTGAYLNIPGNPTIEFNGIVNNFTFDEGWSDPTSQQVTTTASLVCSSTMSVLANKVSGRRTNQADQDYWFPGDKSFNRVAVIADQIFDFGGDTPSAAISATQGVTATRTVTG